MGIISAEHAGMRWPDGERGHVFCTPPFAKFCGPPYSCSLYYALYSRLKRMYNTVSLTVAFMSGVSIISTLTCLLS